jgi:hypothetical protein
MAYWWNYTDKAKPKYSEENLKWCNYVHEEAHMVWSGNQASVVKGSQPSQPWQLMLFGTSSKNFTILSFSFLLMVKQLKITKLT